MHKAEKLQEDDKIGGFTTVVFISNPLIKSENFRQIQERVQDDLMERECEQMPYNFHLTSVYDHSLHEAFSKVLHKLIQSLPFLEDLVNVFCAVS